LGRHVAGGGGAPFAGGAGRHATGPGEAGLLGLLPRPQAARLDVLELSGLLDLDGRNLLVHVLEVAAFDPLAYLACGALVDAQLLADLGVGVAGLAQRPDLLLALSDLLAGFAIPADVSLLAHRVVPPNPKTGQL